MKGTVTRTQGPEYTVAIHHTDTQLACVLQGKRLRQGKPVVGDHVTVTPTDPQRGVITHVETRTNQLVRAGFRRRKSKVLVANIDRLVIVASAQTPPLRSGLLDRYIVAAEHQHMTPVLCFNKWELATHDDRATADVYSQLGYPTAFTSAHRSQGLDTLREHLHNHQSAFVGHSGVGKSSLMRLLVPGEDIAIGDVSPTTGRGQHTTTHARLLPLDGGGFVVDTPGVREFGLLDIDPNDLATLFIDFDPAHDDCRFTPCTHTHEPQCGVKAAVERGDIHPLRYQGYAKLFAELQEVEAQKY